MNIKKYFATTNSYILLAVVLALISGFSAQPWIIQVAHVLSDIFVRLLKLISLPVISFSIMATITGMGSFHSIQKMGKKVLTFTLLTTIISASVALALYTAFNPTPLSLNHSVGIGAIVPQTSYLQELFKVIPSNILQPFIEHNVIGVLFIALLFSFAILALPDEKRIPVHQFIDGIFSAIMHMIRWIVVLMPIAVWSFITQFIDEVCQGLNYQELGVYLLIVVLANLVQAVIVLPLLLRRYGIHPKQAFKAMLPALSFAFFSKSSAASLPLAIECAEKFGVKPRVARFSFPLCTTINMNACAGFILITVLFVSQSNGMNFTGFEKILWVGVATIAAIGNAGVPMGCFFLASALLTTMGVPITLMGVILPFYSLLDMLESAINIWSDSCVTMIVDSSENKKGA